MNIGVPSPGGSLSNPEATIEPSKGLKESITSRGRLLIASCRSGGEMAAQVVEKLVKIQAEAGLGDEIPYLENVDGQFSDSETYARLGQDVSGGDAYLFQAPLDRYPLEAWIRIT
jgi:hypothetical protein